MSEPRANLGVGLLALIPIACCIGLPLIAAAGISVALAAWVGGLAFAALVLIVAVAVLALRTRRFLTRGSPPTRASPRYCNSASNRCSRLISECSFLVELRARRTPWSPGHPRAPASRSSASRTQRSSGWPLTPASVRKMRQESA